MQRSKRLVQMATAQNVKGAEVFPIKEKENYEFFDDSSSEFHIQIPSLEESTADEIVSNVGSSQSLCFKGDSVTNFVPENISKKQMVVSEIHVTDLGLKPSSKSVSDIPESVDFAKELDQNRSDDSGNDYENSESDYEPSKTDVESESESENDSTTSEFSPCQNKINQPEIEVIPSNSKLAPYPRSLLFENPNSNVNEIVRDTLKGSENQCLLPQNEPLDNQKQYAKSASARERPVICPICYVDVATHFTRHLFRHHKNNKEVQSIKNLKPKSKERLALVSALRKQGYFHLKVEKNVVNPVKTSKKPDAKYFVCTYCLGQYTKALLYKHVKTCKNKPDNVYKPGKNCLAESQTLMALINVKNNSFLKLSRIKNEVFSIMRADEISAAAKNDPLICLYGESLLSKHKRQQMATVVSNKLREIGRLLIALKSTCNIRGLFEALKPEMFQQLVTATKLISGHDEKTKSFKSPSLALHMGTNLKIICDVAYKLVLEKKNIPNITWNDHEIKKSEIKDTKKLIIGHWCSEMSSLALKNLKENNWQKPINLPLNSDIQLFHSFLNELAKNAYNMLKDNIELKHNYRILTECVLTLTVIFNRKRIGDVQYLKIVTYTKESGIANEENFMTLLSPVEKIICKKFKRVVSGGKGSKPVPILFPKRIQHYIECLLKIRKDSDIVPQSNEYLFANPGSENRWMAGGNIIRKLANNCGAKHPDLLTSTRFRKHIATTLQLLTMEDDEMEQIATFMGHTKKTHSEFYRLPQDIYQTAKVAKVLMLLEKGRGNEFRGKTLNDINLKSDVYYSSESESEESERPLAERVVENIQLRSKINKQVDLENDDFVQIGSLNLPEVPGPSKQNTECVQSKTDDNCPEKKKLKVTEKCLRKKWTEQEKKMVRSHFARHIKTKSTPRKYEVDEFINMNKNNFGNTEWIKIKTFVYNEFRSK